MILFNHLAGTVLTLAVSGTAFAGETRDIVTAAITKVMINKDVTAIGDYFAEPYVQHNQSVPTGLAAFQGLAGAVIADNPGFNYQLIRLIEDGDIAVTHGIYTGFADVPLVAFDVFRVENGMIVEHWDNLSPVAVNNPSGHSQTDGATDLVDADLTEANKAMISEFYDTVLIGGAFDKLGNYFDGDAYIQHNSNIADGLSGLVSGLQALADAGVTMRLTRRHATYGEGNFVLVLGAGDLAGKAHAFYDLFRVENGKIAEHWDVISPITADADAANTNGKY